MQKLVSLTLPNKLPAEKAIQSWGQNIHDYEPEFWEYQYETYRYLKNISEAELIERYRNICRNFEVLTTGVDRDVIPIHSFLSSWFWYRKEHQTRYEFHLRNINLPFHTPHSQAILHAPFRAKFPNSCDILFRYGNFKYMKLFVEKGEIRISPASFYKDGILNDPKKDDELNKHKWALGDRITITTKDGRQSPIIGDLKETVSIPNDYYVLSMSCDFIPKVFEEFKYDSCVIIKDYNKFVDRIDCYSKYILHNFDFFHFPIEYFDPREQIKDHYFDPVLCKDFVYAYQMEYRFFWIPLEKVKTLDYMFLNLGPLNDICELYTLNL